MTNLSQPMVLPHRDETLSSWLTRWSGDRHSQQSDLLGLVATMQPELVEALRAD